MNERRIVTLIARFYNTCDEIEERAAEALSYDIGYDAGEFCGPAHDRAMRCEMNAAAKRFGFTSVEVLENAAAALNVPRPSAAAYWSLL